MTHPRSLPPDLPDAFTYVEGLAAGVTPRRLRYFNDLTPFRGSRSVFATDDVQSLARAYYPLLGPHRYFSHLTAAILLGFRMPERTMPPALHVTSVYPIRAVRRPGVVAHQAQAPRCEVIDGLPVSAPLTAWLECGQYLGVEDLVIMGDTLVRRRSPFMTIDEIRAGALSHMGRRGARNITLAVPLLRENTDSARESVLRLVLTRAGFPEPEVNGAIANSFGQVIAHGDLVYRDFRTIVEYDGDHHRTSEHQFNIDINRLDGLAEEGWRVIRVTKKLLSMRAMLFGKVETALRAGGWAPTEL